MKKIVVTGAGSAQSNGTINCLLMGGGPEEVIGIGSDLHDLALCKAPRRYLVPHARKPEYKDCLLRFLRDERPDMIILQHDVEIAIALQFRNEIEALGVRMIVPDYDVIDTCVHKYKSWVKFKAAGVPVPENIIIHTEDDLRRAFKELGDDNGSIWLRSMDIGNGGRGSLPTNDFDIAREWIERWKGWGSFLAAELLTEDSVTWLSIWHEGELIVAQTRRRRGWAYGAATVSGISGITKIGETCSSPEVDQVALDAVRAISPRPHGIFGVDMTYDRHGVPCPTEMNISRFFTTIQFFAEAGVNFPVILKDLCLYGKKPDLEKKINPLPDGLLWLRAMDCLPRLITPEALAQEIPDSYANA